MSDIFGNDYTPQVTKTALDSMPFTLPGEEVSKTFTGSDAYSTVASSLATEPQVAGSTDFNTRLNNILTGALSNNLYTDMTMPDGSVIKANPNTKPGGVLRPDSNSILKPILYGALFVVVGLFVISRGFGMIGEEGENVVVSLGDPTKFPGIGHAIQGIKKRK
jgi:hypothetical protein